MVNPRAQEKHHWRVLALKASLLAVWAVVTFGTGWFARDLQFTLGGWPFGYWMAAQGAVLVFILIIVVHAAVMQRLVPEDSCPTPSGNPDA